MNTYNMNLDKSKIFKSKIHSIVPGGSHTYSKGDDQFPEIAPSAIQKGKGAYVWDLDGNKYLDCSMGLTSVSLGHAYQSVIDQVKIELDNGVNFQRPSHLELDMAQTFMSLLPQHDMVKFAKNGSTVTSAAVKLARAKTGRKLIAFPGNHPFYSYDDWFIGKTPCNKGVPEEFSNLSVTFNACDINSLIELFNKYPGQIACVITEPEKSTCNSQCNCSLKGDIRTYLEEAIELTHKNGALFILDEMVTGFKTAFPGSISKYNLKPDMATWGKGIANGFSFCALTGTKDVMELGGINRIGEEKVFLISSTHGAETHSMSAAIETIKIFKEKNVIEKNHKLSRLLIDGCKAIIQEQNLQEYLSIIDCEWMPTFIFKDKKRNICLSMKTLFMQEMIKRGVLFQGIFCPCYSHNENDIHFFLNCFKASINTYSKALDEGYESFLVGEAIKPVFRKIL
jgi:glutamate-1-semialdehyde aminotransferase